MIAMIMNQRVSIAILRYLKVPILLAILRRGSTNHIKKLCQRLRGSEETIFHGGRTHPYSFRTLASNALHMRTELGTFSSATLISRSSQRPYTNTSSSGCGSAIGDSAV